jgi:hypothetical protein
MVHLPPEPRSPEPSITIIEPSLKKDARPRDVLIPILGAELADAMIEHRRAIRKPLTPLSAKLLAGKLAVMRDPHSSARETIERGWTTVYEKEEKPDAQHSRRVSAFLSGARR